MKNSTQNKIFKLTIRMKYIITQIIGLFLISFGLTCIFTSYKLSGQEDFNIFISVLCIVIGIGITIVSVFWRKEIEHLIEKYKL